MLHAFLQQLRNNPLCHLLLRRDFVPSQVAMLIFAVLFSGYSFAYMKSQIINEYHLLILFGVRWAVGEFFWCWMAADHLFTNIGRARHAGKLRDWSLTGMTPSDVASGFAFSTTAFLSLGLLLWFTFDLLNPFPRMVAGPGRMDGLVATLHYGAPWALLAGQFPTILLATTLCTSRALEPQPGTFGRWPATMLRLAGLSWVSLWPGILAAWIIARLQPQQPLIPTILLILFVLIGNSLKIRFAWPALEKAALTLQIEGTLEPGT